MNTLGLAFFFGLLLIGLLLFFVFYLLTNPAWMPDKESIVKLSEPNETLEEDLSFQKAVEEAKELEKQRISVEIHDEFSMPLHSFRLDLETVSMDLTGLHPKAEKKILDMRYKVDNMIEALRRILEELLPSALEQNTLDTAIEELCNNIDAIKGTRISFSATGKPFFLSDPQKLNIYRIIQELLSNTVKHSLAWNITVALTWSSEGLKVMVRDDGVGMFKVSKETGKYGLSGIFLRAQLLGAQARFNTPHSGTEFELYLPHVEEEKYDEDSASRVNFLISPYLDASYRIS